MTTTSTDRAYVHNNGRKIGRIARNERGWWAFGWTYGEINLGVFPTADEADTKVKAYIANPYR